MSAYTEMDILRLIDDVESLKAKVNFIDTKLESLVNNLIKALNNIDKDMVNCMSRLNQLEAR